MNPRRRQSQDVGIWDEKEVFNDSLELQLEPVTLQSIVILLIEPVLDGGPGSMPGCIILNLRKDAEVFHLVGKIPAVETDFQD